MKFVPLVLLIAWSISLAFGLNAHGVQCEREDKPACQLLEHLNIDHIFHGRAFMPQDPQKLSHIPVKISFADLFTEKSLLRRSNVTTLPKDVLEVIEKHRTTLVASIGEMVYEYFTQPIYDHRRLSPKNETPYAFTWRLKRVPNLSSTNYKTLLNGPGWNRTLITGPRAIEQALHGERRRIGEVFRLDMEMKALRNDVLESVRDMIKEGRLPEAIYPQQVDQVLERHFGIERYRNSLWNRYSFLKYAVIKTRPVHYIDGVLSLELDVRDYPMEALHPVFKVIHRGEFVLDDSFFAHLLLPDKFTYIQANESFQEYDESSCRKLVITQELYTCDPPTSNESSSFPPLDAFRARLDRSKDPEFKAIRKFARLRYVASKHMALSHDPNSVVVSNSPKNKPGQFEIEESLQKRFWKEDRDVYEFNVRSDGFRIVILDPFPVEPSGDDHTRIIIGLLSFVTLSVFLIMLCKIYHRLDEAGSYNCQEHENIKVTYSNPPSKAMSQC